VRKTYIPSKHNITAGNRSLFKYLSHGSQDPPHDAYRISGSR